ncbi:MAG: hypothetical protein R2864_10800 [Syntrophotaleaceae bacterium]
MQRFAADPELLAAARPLITAAAIANGVKLATGPMVTVSTCSGTDQAAQALVRRTQGICENMKGGRRPGLPALREALSRIARHLQPGRKPRSQPLGPCRGSPHRPARPDGLSERSPPPQVSA